MLAGELGDPCEIDPDCADAIADTYCPAASKICDCQPGFYIENQGCVRSKLY